MAGCIEGVLVDLTPEDPEKVPVPSGCIEGVLVDLTPEDPEKVPVPSGCIEGVLVDLTPEDPEKVPVPADSIEVMRTEPPRIRRGSYTVASSMKCNTRILCDVTDKGNIIDSPHKHGGLDSPHIVSIEDETFDFELPPVTPLTATDKSRSNFRLWSSMGMSLDGESFWAKVCDEAVEVASRIKEAKHGLLDIEVNIEDEVFDFNLPTPLTATPPDKHFVDTRMGASPEKTKTIEKPKEQTGKSASKLPRRIGVKSCKQAIKPPSPEEPNEGKPASRLSMPKADIAAKEISASGSKLRASGLSRSNSTANRPKQIPQKSSIPGLPGRGVPASKRQLMKPGSLLQKKAPSGPMNAVPLQTKVAKTAEGAPVTPPSGDKLA